MTFLVLSLSRMNILSLESRGEREWESRKIPREEGMSHKEALQLH